MEFSNAVVHYAGNTTDVNLTCRINNESYWLIDSGATCHIAVHKHLFTTFELLRIHQSIFLPNGSSCEPKFVGTILINPAITLTYVYYIPSFKFNLISVSALSRHNNFSLIFSNGQCSIQGLSSNQILGTTHQQGNLFILSSPLFSLVTQSNEEA